MGQYVLKGSCLCGSVKFEVTGEPTRFYHCHCSRCRKVTGTGHASNLFLQPASLMWLSGEERVGSFKVPEAKRFINNFCANCGSRLPRQAPNSDVVMIPAGSLDDAAPIRPQARIFGESRASWSCTDGDIPVYPQYPPPQDRVYGALGMDQDTFHEYVRLFNEGRYERLPAAQDLAAAVIGGSTEHAILKKIVSP